MITMSTATRRGHSFLLGIVLLVAVIARPASASTAAPPSFHRSGMAATAPAVEMLGSAGSIRALAVKQGDLAYIGEAAALNIVDLHDIAHPVRLGSALLPESIMSIDIAGDLVYVGTSVGLHILNVSDPAHPAPVGELALPNVERVQVVGARVYLSLTDSQEGLYVVDASDQAHPRIAGRYITGHAFYDWHVVGTLAYIATGELVLVDLGDPAQPVVRGRYPESVFKVFAVGTIAYAIRTDTDANRLVILDTSVPAQPKVLGSTVVSPPTSFVNAVRVFGNRAYILTANQSGSLLEVVDVGNPAQIASCGTYSTDGVDIQVSGTRAYLPRSSEALVLDVSSCVPPPRLGSYESVLESSLDLVVSGNFAYAIAGNRFDQANPSRFLMIDVSDPANPTHRGSYPNAQQSWVAGGFAYIIEGESALSILDLSNPDLPARRGTLSLPRIGGLGGLGDVPVPIRVIDGIAYVVEGYSPFTALDNTIAEADVRYRIHIVDVHDPGHPAYLGTMLDDSPSVTDIAAVGNLVYVASGFQITIVDASTPAQPVVRGFYTDTKTGATAIEVQGALAYISGPGGLAILNVQDALHPVLLGRYQPYPASDAQNLTTKAFETKVDGRWAYVGVGSSRTIFRDIVDVTNPSAPLLRLRYPAIGSMQLANGLQYFGGSGNSFGEGIIIRRVDPEQLPPPVWLPIISRQG
jgi:hypothetical protein